MIKAIVTDIEGTTSSLSFVKDELFPYARQRIAHYVCEHAGEPQVMVQVQQVRTLMAEEQGLVVADISLDQVGRQLERWIDEDRKITALKSLQGMIWETGYRNGDFFGHLYPDAEAALRRWHAAGIALYVYSSGSIYAQKLLFGHTRYGDLTPLFKGYFDTTTGAKQEADAYRRIVATIGLPAQETLFLSDIEAELDAARAAGMQTCWLVREGVLSTSAAHRQVRDFTAISL